MCHDALFERGVLLIALLLSAINGGKGRGSKSRGRERKKICECSKTHALTMRAVCLCEHCLCAGQRHEGLALNVPHSRHNIMSQIPMEVAQLAEHLLFEVAGWRGTEKE